MFGNRIPIMLRSLSCNACLNRSVCLKSTTSCRSCALCHCIPRAIIKPLSSSSTIRANAILSCSFSHSYHHPPVTSAPQGRPSSSSSATTVDAVLIPSSSGFVELADRRKFVDKSLAIDDFLQEDKPIHLLLRPRRSGKTTLLRMFRTFFECTNLAEHARRKELFKKNDLAITRQPKFEAEFGQYPVLYLDLSVSKSIRHSAIDAYGEPTGAKNVIGSSMEELLQEFKIYVSAIVRQLKRDGLFKNLHELDEDDRIFLHDIQKKQLDDSEWPTVLFELTRLLHNLHKKKVVLLVDEYDTPTSHAVQDAYFPEANKFFRKVFSPLLKNNEHIRGALLVGILRVAKVGWLSGVNNLIVFSLGESKRYSTACMFTEDETRMVYNRQSLALQGVEALPFTFEDLQLWYNGYHTLDGRKLYNPWSIARALTERELCSYWVESGYDRIIQERIFHLLKTNDHFRAQMAELVVNRPIRIEVEEEMSYQSMPKLTVRELWTLMLNAGYLTKLPSIHSAIDPDTIVASISGGEGKLITATIPNQEIQTVFGRWIHTDFERRLSPELRGQSVLLFDNMVYGSMALFAHELRNHVFRSMPSQIFGSKEEVYQASIQSYLAGGADANNSTPQWEIRMERPAGAGRLDLIVKRFGESRSVILELKRVKHDKPKGYGASEAKRLTKETGDAAGQHDTRHYRATLPGYVTELREYGVAFMGPYCAVEGRFLERKAGGQWTVKDLYSAEQDEKDRTKVYAVSS